MSALRGAVCQKLGLSLSATQADIYRAALKKIGKFGARDEAQAAFPGIRVERGSAEINGVRRAVYNVWIPGSGDIGYGMTEQEAWDVAAQAARRKAERAGR